MGHPFPESLTRRCYRCKFPILWSTQSITAILNGTAVNMHPACHQLWSEEVQKMRDEEIMGTENVSKEAS
jgi:hypothetical protein